MDRDEVEAVIIARVNGETMVIPLRALLRIDISFGNEPYTYGWRTFTQKSYTVEVTGVADGMTIYPGQPSDFAPDESGQLPVLPRAIKQ